MMQEESGRPGTAVAAILGGAVTRERLQCAAQAAGRPGSPLVRSLAAQPLPGLADLARSYARGNTPLRLDDSLLAVSSAAARLLDPALLREHRCVPVELFDDFCILAVTTGRERSAVAAVRRALGRDVLPVLAETAAVQRLLGRLAPELAATPRAGFARRDTAVHARFRDLALSRVVLEAIATERVR